MNTAKLRVLPYVAFLVPADLLVGIVLLLSELVRIPSKFFRQRVPEFAAPDTMCVTIQILNWDGRHLLEEFLPGVLCAAKGHRVIVVDNGSVDGSVEWLKARFPDVGIVTLDRNYGFSAGNNKGIAFAKTDVVVLLNNDMAVEPGFLAPLLQPFSDPSVFAVASAITVPDPSKAHHETGRTRGAFERGLFHLWHEAPPSNETDSSKPVPVFWAGGGACALDRRKFELLGGFDTLYHPFYVEDADLSYQAWKRGWKSLVAPSSRVVHRHRGTSGPRFGDDVVNSTIRRNFFLLVWKNVTDARMLLGHILQLPRMHGREMMTRGARFEMRAYLRAVGRLPLAVYRRLANAPAYTVGDRETLRMSR